MIDKWFIAYLWIRYADHVSVGDEVLAVQDNKELTPAKVINISNINMKGTFYLWICCSFLSVVQESQQLACLTRSVCNSEYLFMFTICASTNYKMQVFLYNINLLSRCLCTSDNGRYYCDWWCVSFFLSFYSSWLGSHWNDTNQMVS